MSKILKLKKELNRTQEEIKRLKEKETLLQDKIDIEEYNELKKLRKSKDISHERLIKILNEAN